MSSITERPDSLLQNGPHVAVKLWVPRSVKSTPPPIDAMAELNIALPHTCIQEGVATSLGLEPSGILTITTATKPMYEAYQYLLRIVFPEMAFEVMAIEVPYMIRPRQRIKCLIGRDILQYYVLTYNGPANTFALEFRPLQSSELDFRV